MRRLLKKASITALVLMLMLSMTVCAFAADASVTYNGGEFKFGPGSEMSETQLFPELENVMPGDVLTQKITVTNKSDNSDYIKIYLRAEAHDETTNPLETGVKDTETVASMTDFLKQLGMKVDKKRIDLEGPLKQLGTYDVTIKLFQEIKGVLKVELTN